MTNTIFLFVISLIIVWGNLFTCLLVVSLLLYPFYIFLLFIRTADPWSSITYIFPFFLPFNVIYELFFLRLRKSFMVVLNLAVFSFIVFVVFFSVKLFFKKSLVFFSDTFTVLLYFYCLFIF